MTSHTDIYKLLHRKPKKEDTGLGDVEFQSEPPINEGDEKDDR